MSDKELTVGEPDEYERQRLEREKESDAARLKFVAMVKDENYYHEPYSRWSLKQHWSGARGGFADEQLQTRWHDFEAGWKAAKGIQ